MKRNVPIDTALSKPTDGGVPYKTSGIYVFKQKRKVIYLGMSSTDIRNRIQVWIVYYRYFDTGTFFSNFVVKSKDSLMKNFQEKIL